MMGLIDKQLKLWLESEKQRAVVVTRIRELEIELAHLNDVIETLKPNNVRPLNDDDGERR